MNKDTDLVEIVGGNLKGLWALINKQYIAIYFFDEDDRVVNARLDAEIAEKQPGVAFYSQGKLELSSTLGYWVGQGLGTLWKKLQFKRAQSNDASEFIPLAVYPLNCTIAHCSEESIAFIRSSSEAEYEISRTSDKVALAQTSSGLFSTSTVLGASLRDSILDDLRELPEEQKQCLVIRLVDNNSIVISEYTKEQRSILNSASMGLTDTDFTTLNLLFDDPATVKSAIQADLAKKVSNVEGETSLTALLAKKQAEADQEKYRKLVKLCDELLSNRLNHENSDLDIAGGVVGSLSLSLDKWSASIAPIDNGVPFAQNHGKTEASSPPKARGDNKSHSKIQENALATHSSTDAKCTSCGSSMMKKMKYCPQCGKDR